MEQRNIRYNDTMERRADIYTDWTAEQFDVSDEHRTEDRACRHLWSVLFILIVVVAAGSALGAVAFGRTDAPGENLSFVSQYHNQPSIINALDLEHGFAFSVTRLDTGDDSPAWSPDGKQLAFVSWRDAHRNLFVMNVDTRATQKISDLRIALHDQPKWSPDGQRIAFEVEENGDIDLAVADVPDGTLEMLAVSPEQDRSPVWSPDGKHIAYVSWRNGNAEIYLADLSCGGSLCADPTNVTHTHGSDAYPSWSPDGRSIAFLSDRDGYREVYSMDSTCDSEAVSCNRRVRKLTNERSKANDQVWSAPAWSPDSRKLAYLSNSDDTTVQIKLIDVVAARAKPACCDNPRQVTFGPWDNTNVAWSADGKSLAFTSHQNGNWDIYVMNADGGGLRQVTSSPADEYAPGWMPQLPPQSLSTAFAALR